jgi:hypothetical protein
LEVDTDDWDSAGMKSATPTIDGTPPLPCPSEFDFHTNPPRLALPLRFFSASYAAPYGKKWACNPSGLVFRNRGSDNFGDQIN